MMKDEAQVGVILRELQERAKELNCLYKVDELLNRSDLSLEQIFRAMIDVLPAGWQYTHDCQARIIFEDHAIEPDSPYGASKLCAEKETLAFGKLYGIETVCMRYFNI